MGTTINKEHTESDDASELPFALKSEIWNIFSAEQSGANLHKFGFTTQNQVITITLQKFLDNTLISEKTFFWENPIKINPPSAVWIEARDHDILMRLPDDVATV